MTANHLLSASLFAELFQHNLVSPDGRIIANRQQLRDYSTFLIKQSKDRVTSLYAERKNLVDDVEQLLRLDVRTEEEEELLEKLINELDLKFEEDGLLSLKKPKKPKERSLGPKEPKKSIFERKIEAELERVKILKRDLKKLDDWLEQLSHFTPESDKKESHIDWKEYGMKFRQRTKKRMCDMDNARTKLIKQYYKDYETGLRSLLDQKLPKKQYLTRISDSKAADEREGKTSSNKKDTAMEAQKDPGDKTAKDKVKDGKLDTYVKIKEDSKDRVAEAAGRKSEMNGTEKEDDVEGDIDGKDADGEEEDSAKDENAVTETTGEATEVNGERKNDGSN